MGLRVIPSKWTADELALIDDLATRLKVEGRSAVLREAVYALAADKGVSRKTVKAVQRSRTDRPDGRSGLRRLARDLRRARDRHADALASV